MKLIIGLGNPGKEYEKTRHNVGFMAVDTLARGISGGSASGGSEAEPRHIVFSNWKHEKKLGADVCRGFIASCCEDVILAKPQTFMNNSGRAVQLLVTRYRLRVTDILVVHDDLDLGLGTLKLSHGSGSAGHNGVQSIIDTLGTKDFWRLRIGIGRPRDQVTHARDLVTTQFVLHMFSRTEQPHLKKVLALAAHAVQMMFELGPQRAQTEINNT